MQGQAIGAGAVAVDAPWASRRSAWSRLRGAWMLLMEQAREGREIDGAVLRRARHGDHGAFHEIVDHYEGRLRVLAYHLLRDSEQMNDALQDTFVKAWAGLPGAARLSRRSRPRYLAAPDLLPNLPRLPAPAEGTPGRGGTRRAHRRPGRRRRERCAA